jgi:hypothetical protein
MSGVAADDTARAGQVARGNAVSPSGKRAAVELPPPETWLRSLAAQGYGPWISPSGHCWIRTYPLCRARFPDNCPAPLAPDEHPVLRGPQRALLISHHHEPGPGETANAVLYLCRQRGYDLQHLSANNRSKIRRGLRRHEIREIDPVEAGEQGYDCYVDTWARNRLTPWTKSAFCDWWIGGGPAECRHVWGAYADGVLMAYCAAQVCGPHVAMCASAARTAGLRDYPNNALCFHILRYFLADDSPIASVSFGLSSIQADSHLESLHQYKLSLGFEALPVVRVIGIHPVMSLFVNRPVLRMIRAAQAIRPRNLFLCKLRAAFEHLVEGRHAGAGIAAGAGE